MKILITGSAGFIGYHLVKRLLGKGDEIYGLDNLNSYYDTRLKYDRLAACGITAVPEYGEEVKAGEQREYTFIRMDLEDAEGLQKLFASHSFDVVVNLAAQAGVRYSLSHPEQYVQSNITGFLNLLECCRKCNGIRVIYASSSSVYGNNTSTPFREDDRTDRQVSMYAVSKRCNELMAFTYAQLYGLQMIGLRFFTVYGPYGRPDMAPMLFAGAIVNGEEIRIFNNGELWRDFTCVEDIVEGMEKIILTPGIRREDVPGIPSTLYNIGRGEPVFLLDFIRLLEEKLGRTAKKQYVEMQPGDVYKTWAATDRLREDYGYAPQTSLEEGITRFTGWLKEMPHILSR